MGAFPKSRTFVFLALKGGNIPAQGNALGYGARSQALPGNVFRGGSATYELNRRQSRQGHVPRQSLGTSTGASLP
jgi:hypothetical protein